MVLVVKNMVCNRCLLAVKTILQQNAIDFNHVGIGEIYLEEPLAHSQYQQLQLNLSAIGLELIGNKMNGITERIRQLLIRKARNEVKEAEKRMKLSSFLTSHLYHEYSYLSSLFSAVEGRTIENYFLLQRIEKVKELLVYNEMTLLDIAVELEFSSVAHLSNQFKQLTGLTPSHFRKIGAAKRTLLDAV